ncbi:TPA: hypothetical protein N0F65_012192 [Lagenidium giganteum]|uniref:Uncharacterized protein n=1 Tax=Lagenidium giganteum TaxID=4803 RepID=A0AAV2ZIJ2_9STRA|nr:TPA: hypothetical protein N0F65_012192 [Lagenidium giganteum]
MFGDQDLKKECGAHNSPSLLLSARSLYGVPCSIFLRSPLRELDLSGNCLIDIPPAIGSLSHLEVLNISQNALLQVPAAVSNLAELKVLNLSHNNIKSLPASLFESMKKLSVLDLRVNLLTHLPVSVVKLSSLRVLMVAHNFIKWSHAEVATRQLTCTVDINQTKSTIPLCASPKAPNTRRNDDDAQKEKQRDQQVVSRDTHTVTALTITSENAKSDDEAEVSMVEAVESTSITSAVAVAAEEAQVSTEPAASKGSDAEGASQHGDATEDAAVRTAPAAPTSSDTNISQQPSPVNADETNDVTMESADIVEESKEEESELEEDGFMIVEPPQQQQRSSSNRHVEDDSSAAASPTRSTSSAATSELSAFEQVKKLMEDQKKSRAQIKRDHPELWRQFAEQSFLFYTSLGNCALCGCSNDDGKNQRLNTMVLCPDCLAVGLDVLRSKSTKPVHRSLW